MRLFSTVARPLVASLVIAAALVSSLVGTAPVQSPALLANDGPARTTSPTGTVPASTADTGVKSAESPSTSMPTTTSSYYIHSASTTELAADGAEAGRQAAKPGDNLVVLMFGCPVVSGTTQGAESYDGSYASIPQIEAATEAFITGYLDNALPATHLSVVVGTSNYGNNVTTEHGAAWGAMMNDIFGWITNYSLSSRVFAYGGNDIEGGWGPPSQAVAWVDAYHSATNIPLVNFGDTEGLPTTNDGGAVHAAYGWTFEDYWYVAGGSGKTLALPQIYNTTFAKEWYQLLRFSLTKTGYPPIEIIGVLTMQKDAQQTGGGRTLSPGQAWKLFAGLINSDPQTAQTPKFTTDIMKDWLP